MNKRSVELIITVVGLAISLMAGDLCHAQEASRSRSNKAPVNLASTSSGSEQKNTDPYLDNLASDPGVWTGSEFIEAARTLQRRGTAKQKHAALRLLKTHYIDRKEVFEALSYSQVDQLVNATRLLGGTNANKIAVRWMTACEKWKNDSNPDDLVGLAKCIQANDEASHAARRRYVQHIEQRYLSDVQRTRLVTPQAWRSIVHYSRLNNEKRTHWKSALWSAFVADEAYWNNQSFDQAMETAYLLKIFGDKRTMPLASGMVDRYADHWKQLSVFQLKRFAKLLADTGPTGKQGRRKVAAHLYAIAAADPSEMRQIHIQNWYELITCFHDDLNQEEKRQWTQTLRQAYVENRSVFRQWHGGYVKYISITLVLLDDPQADRLAVMWLGEDADLIDRLSIPQCAWYAARLPNDTKDEQITQARNRLARHVTTHQLQSKKQIESARPAHWETVARGVESALSPKDRQYWFAQLKPVFDQAIREKLDFDPQRLSHRIRVLHLVQHKAAAAYLLEVQQDAPFLSKLEIPQVTLLAQVASETVPTQGGAWGKLLVRRCSAECRSRDRINGRFLSDTAEALQATDPALVGSFVDQFLGEPTLRKKTSMRDLAWFSERLVKTHPNPSSHQRWASMLHDVYMTHCRAQKRIGWRDFSKLLEVVGTLNAERRNNMIQQVLFEDGLRGRFTQKELPHLVEYAQSLEQLDLQAQGRLYTALLEDSRSDPAKARADALTARYQSLNKLDENLARQWLQTLIGDEKLRRSILPFELAHFAYRTSGRHPEIFKLHAEDLSKLWIDELAQGAPPESTVWQVHDFWLHLDRRDLDKAWVQALFKQMENYQRVGLGYPADNLWHIAYLTKLHDLSGAGKGSMHFAECLAVHVADGQWKMPEAQAMHHANLVSTDAARRVLQQKLIAKDGSVRLSLAKVLAWSYKQVGGTENWLESLQSHIDSTTGDVQASWLLAMAYSDKVAPVRVNPLRQFKWLNLAMAVSETEEMRMHVAQQLVNEYQQQNKSPAALTLLQSIKHQFRDREHLAYIDKKTSDLERAIRQGRQAAQAKRSNAEAAVQRSQLAYFKQMLARAERDGNKEAIAKLRNRIEAMTEK